MPFVGEHKSRPLSAEWNARSGTRYLPIWPRLDARRKMSTSSCARICMPTTSAEHAGLKSGRWLPTFPNARYVMSRRAIDQRARDAARNPRPISGSFQDSVLPASRPALRRWRKLATSSPRV